MKRILCILSAFLIVLSLGGCVRSINSDITSETTAQVAADTTASTDEDTTAAPEPEKTGVTIRMVGDVLLHEAVTESGLRDDGTYNFDHLFKNVLDEIKSADIALVNQEVILGGKEMGLSGYPAFNGPFEVGDAIANAGFDIVLHATNHALDRGSAAVVNCCNFWRTSHPDISFIGISDSSADQNNIVIKEAGGIKIAFLNYTYGTNGIPLPAGTRTPSHTLTRILFAATRLMRKRTPISQSFFPTGARSTSTRRTPTRNTGRSCFSTAESIL